MAIVFLQQRKKIISYLLIIIILVLLTWLVVKKGVLGRPFQKEEGMEVPITPAIDFSILLSPKLKALEFLEDVPPLEEEAGRENPFVPYELKAK